MPNNDPNPIPVPTPDALLQAAAETPSGAIPNAMDYVGACYTLMAITMLVLVVRGYQRFYKARTRLAWFKEQAAASQEPTL